MYGLQIQILFFFILANISFVFNQDTYKCDISRCSQYAMNNNDCVYYHPLNTNSTQAIYEISLNCPEGNYCPPLYGKQNQTCQVRPPQSNLVDGEVCRNNTDCSSNICNNAKCQGLSDSQVCTDSSQCKIGFYCGKNNVTMNCMPQVGAGKNCASDFDCVNNNGCNLLNNTCTPYLSLADGSQVHKGGNLLCQSMKSLNGYCVTLKLDQNSDECQSVNGTLQSSCLYKASGVANSNEYPYNSTCQCSKAYSNRNFCEYDSQHPNWQKLINALKEYYFHDAPNKHTVRRNNFNYELRKQYVTVTRYPQFKDSDDCSINLEIGSNFNTLSILIFALILFILN